jgi:porin
MPSIEEQAEGITNGQPFWEWEQLTGDWGGARPWLAQQGISLEPWWIMDASQNWHGGVNTEGGAFRHLFGVDLTLDTEAMFGLPGGTFFVQFQNHTGPDSSVDDTGDFQVYSNIDADGRTQVAELWYEQWFLEDMFRVKVGKVEANSEFAYVDNGVEFIHSTPGFTPTISVFPSYPDPALSLNLFAYPTDYSYIGFGIYDGALQSGFNTGEYGPSTLGHEGWFYIGEGGFIWDGGATRLNGRLGLGGWYHNGTFERFQEGKTQDGNGGFYITFDQMLWREQPEIEDDEQGIGMYVYTGHSDPDANEADHSVSGGLIWTGLVPQRDDDILGFGANYVHFSQKSGAGFIEPYELAYELFYKIQITPALSIKPDLQYITNPGGAGLSDAFVATLRMEFAF